MNPPSLSSWHLPLSAVLAPLEKAGLLALPTSLLQTSDPSRSFSLITANSRECHPESLFIALPGNTQDGHQYLLSALSQGATVLYEPSRFDLPPQWEDKGIAVHHSFSAYRVLARRWREQATVPIVAIAGSVGKTTTKEFLAALCRGKYGREEVLATLGSQNGWQGIPQTLLRLRSFHRVAVVEIGIDAPEAMEAHLELVAPTHTLLTAIAPEHLDGLKDLETVAQEELKALSWTLKHQGQVFINASDPLIRIWACQSQEGLARQRRFFMMDTPLPPETPPLSPLWKGRPPALSPPPQVAYLPELAIFEESSPSESLLLPLVLPGAHNALNLLGAATVASSLGLSPEEMRTGLASFEPLEGRSVLKKLPKGPWVFCDYYNAQPASMKSALEWLAQFCTEHPPLRPWLCLGDMLGLDAQTDFFHRELAYWIRALPRLSDLQCFLYGSNMRSLAQELLSPTGTQAPVQAQHFLSQTDLIDQLRLNLSPHHTPDSNQTPDTVVLLLKGSHAMQMENIWTALSSLFFQKA